VKKGLIVEDFKPLAEIWRQALSKEGFTSIEHTDDTDVLEELISSLQPDLVLMDINLKGRRNGIEAVRDLLLIHPGLPVIFLSMHGQPHMFELAMDAGARSYITKSSPIIELHNAIKAVQQGELYICEAMRKYWQNN
jgi:DNA-binding NarL/FixJ family response regulator